MKFIDISFNGVSQQVNIDKVAAVITYLGSSDDGAAEVLLSNGQVLVADESVKSLSERLTRTGLKMIAVSFYGESQRVNVDSIAAIISNSGSAEILIDGDHVIATEESVEKLTERLEHYNNE